MLKLIIVKNKNTGWGIGNKGRGQVRTLYINYEKRGI